MIELVDQWFLAAAAILLVAMAAGMVRVIAGPTRPDRMLGAQLAGTTSVAVLLLLSFSLKEPALRDAALMFSLLAAVAVVAFVKRAWIEARPDQVRP